MCHPRAGHAADALATSDRFRRAAAAPRTARSSAVCTEALRSSRNLVLVVGMISSELGPPSIGAALTVEDARACDDWTTSAGILGAAVKSAEPRGLSRLGKLARRARRRRPARRGAQPATRRPESPWHRFVQIAPCGGSPANAAEQAGQYQEPEQRNHADDRGVDRTQGECGREIQALHTATPFSSSEQTLGAGALLKRPGAWTTLGGGGAFHEKGRGRVRMGRGGPPRPSSGKVDEASSHRC